ncbi:MAG: glycosyltransferase family 2 protein [Planctomycetota bacterium]
MRVLVVIVNFRTAKLVEQCLASLAGERSGGHELRVTVVDNPGGDDSLATLRAAIDRHHWTDWVDLVAMPRNGGFAYGVNAGVQPALAGPAPPDAFLLLNPDTWVRPGAVGLLVDFLAAHPDIGMAGARLEDADGTGQHSRFRFPSIASELDHGLQLGIVARLLHRCVTCPPLVDTPHQIDWLSGACVLIRRPVFERTGPFDDGYFLYFEELDFARRAHRLGIRSWYVPQSRVVHLVGQSTGVTVRDRRPPRTPAYWFQSRNRYYGKHHGRLYKLAADLAFACGRAMAHLLDLLRGRPDTRPPHFLRDFVRHNLWFARKATDDRLQ